MITVQRESYDEAVEDVKVLLPIHWAEMAQNREEIPLDPDWAMFQKAFSMDFCRIYTVRKGRELVGYVIFFVTPRHLHYNHRFAKDDTIWIHSAYRSIGAATQLFDLFEADLSADGPIVIQIETRFGHAALEAMCRSRGYYDTGRVFGKRFA